MGVRVRELEEEQAGWAMDRIVMPPKEEHPGAAIPAKSRLRLLRNRLLNRREAIEAALARIDDRDCHDYAELVAQTLAVVDDLDAAAEELWLLWKEGP
jgi:hypothetical protein